MQVFNVLMTILLTSSLFQFQDHINFTIGRQSFNLKQLENATAAFKHLLSLDSKQSPPQQAAFLREYLFVYRVSNGSRFVWVHTAQVRK